MKKNLSVSQAQNEQITEENSPIKVTGKYKPNYHGIIIPIESGGGDDINPNIIVRIIPELNQPFNTKMRAPFKIVCEVIKYNELIEKEIL